MYKSLDKKGITVMRINAIISAVIIMAIVLIALYFCLINIEEEFIRVTAIIISVIISLLVLLDIFLFPVIRYNRYKYLITNERIEVKKGLFLT